MPTVTIYKTRFCPYCIAASRFLRKVKHVEVQEIDLSDDDAGLEDLERRTGRQTVPQIWIGERHVGGYDDLRALEARGELDLILKG